MTTAQLAPTPIFRGVDNNGNPLAGGFLWTYAAGTSTPQASYPSSSEATPNTNPIVLNARGECALWLDPTLSYKLLLTDSLGNTIPGYPVDNIVGPAIYISGFITQTAVGTALWPQTTMEIATGQTPASFIDTTSYTNVMRYVTNNVDGVQSQAAAFQAAINVAKKGAGDVIVPAPPYIGGAYVIDSPLNCTYPIGNVTNQPFAIRGFGRNAAFTPNNPYYPPILLKTTGAAFDFTGNLAIDVQDLAITTDPTTFPTVCFLLARNSDKRSATAYFKNVRVIGSFSDAVEGNCGVEQVSRESCKYWNNLTTGATKVVRLSANNVAGYSSTFTTIASGNAQSTTVQRFKGCDLQSSSTNALADLVYVEAAADISFEGMWSAMAGGRAVIYADATNNVTPRVTVRDWKCEVVSTQAHFVDFSNNAPGGNAFSGWKFDNVEYYGTSHWLNVEGSAAIIDQLAVDQIIEASSSGINIPGTLQNSIVSYLGPMTIGTSSGNELHGNPASWTITTRSADFWYGFTSGDLSWTPVTTNLTISGALTVSNKRVHYEGQLVRVSCQLSAATSISCAAGVTLGGLPLAVTVNSADVQVANATANTGLAGGTVVSGTSINLPAISVGANVPIIISAAYFAA